MLDIKKITKEYYSSFLGVNLEKHKQGENIMFIKNELRALEVKGYGCRFSIVVYVSDGNIIVSYSPDKEKEINQLKVNFNETISKFHHQVLFEYQNLDLNIDTSDVKVLMANDYPAYELFFKEINPNLKDISWLKEYFVEKTKKKYFTGLYKGKKLVCVCDAPDMPYMNDKIQHTGIATIPEEIRKGYARKVAYFTAKHLLFLNVCPQWDTTYTNHASIGLAKIIGYKHIADAYILVE